MRKILPVLIIVLFCSWVTPGYAGDLKLGFINLTKVLDNYEKVKIEEAQLQKELEQKEKQKEKLVNEVKSLREKISLLKDKKREKKQQQLNEKINKLREFDYEMRTELGQKKDEKLREISKEIKEVVQEYGQSRNYDIIFDALLLHYRDDSLDVTDDITKILNQRYKKKR